MVIEKNIKHKKIRLKSPSAWILFICFIISLAFLNFYLLENNYDESLLLFILVVIRYSAFMVFICSFYKLLLNFYRIIIKRRKVHPVKIIIYFILLVYGICVFLLEALIIAISRGNA